MTSKPYSLSEFKKQPLEFRIGAVIADGMWYSHSKWRRIANATEDEINKWIERHLADGTLLQSSTGAKSYRFPLSSIQKWHRENNIEVGSQLVEFLFPPRIWAGLTETEGFLNAPLREIGVVTFVCSSYVAQTITERLRGIARVREAEPGQYKAYSLEVTTVKAIVEEVFKESDPRHVEKTYSRASAKRREMVDFPTEFSHGIVMFYKNFGKTLVKSSMETIRIFLPNIEDQEAQIVMWVMTAIEKFNEDSSVPFSGYLDSVLRRWPYDLPYMHLGKDLSNFQRQRAKAVEKMKKDDDRTSFTSEEIANEMNIDLSVFHALDEQHKMWLSTRAATNLTWAENNEERMGANFVTGLSVGPSKPNDLELSHQLSLSVVQAAIASGSYDDAFTVISQIDTNDLNLSKIGALSPEFVKALGAKLEVQRSVSHE